MAKTSCLCRFKRTKRLMCIRPNASRQRQRDSVNCCVFFAPFSVPRAFLETIRSRQWRASLLLLHVHPKSPPLSLSCPPHTLNVICWLLCLISAFGQHFWAEMDAIVTNRTIAKTRKMLFWNSFLRACSRVPGQIWRRCKYAYLCCW